MGQGFSPETIDKLLKIIGNVVQQVDILQKNLNPSKEASGPGRIILRLPRPSHEEVFLGRFYPVRSGFDRRERLRPLYLSVQASGTAPVRCRLRSGDCRSAPSPLRVAGGGGPLDRAGRPCPFRMATTQTKIFSYRNSHAKRVAIRADFTGWKAEPMQRDAAGVWTYKAALSPGEYAYCYSVDDKPPLKDPINKRTKADRPRGRQRHCR